MGQIALGITFIVSLISGTAILLKHIRKYITNTLKPQLGEINVSIRRLEDRLDNVDLESCKNYLVQVIAEIDGPCKNGHVDATQKQRFYEQYEHYVKGGGNSYIRHRVEQLQAEKKI